MAMAMQSGIGISKILIIAGAGYAGTVLFKNGKLSELIGELQLLVKGLEKSGDQVEGEGDYADAIAAQVHHLANEIRRLVSSESITVLNGGSGQSNLSSLVTPAAALGVLGYGYIRWKGISFSDLMYVTKRNMEKAVADLMKKLQHASDVTADAKTHLTQKIQNLDYKMRKQNELARSTKDGVSGVGSTITNLHDEVGLVQEIINTFGERLDIVSLMQDRTNLRLAQLIAYTQGKPWKIHEFSQVQLKLSWKSPGLLTYSGTPNGLKDIAETLSSGLDRSASDTILPDGMDKLEQQQRPLLRIPDPMSPEQPKKALEIYTGLLQPDIDGKD